ncbi:unnamed protein product [Caenorhabditis auriculariae]|uniref:Bestrophin homolog n=1 Tax=Caenorhabditis auriculariae TaxID=2777116 RepID=A0A8S1HC01_9PELO|nr:unnamed protein product [Caenorhabditis auriculariae]
MVDKEGNPIKRRRLLWSIPPEATEIAMTVSYNLDVSSASIISFLRLQLRWRGSIWKSVLKELAMFVFAFSCVSIVYRTDLFLSKQQRKIWDNFAALFDQTMDFIPLTFMLGFFVTIIVRRWNDIFANLGWIDNTAIMVATYIRGDDDRTRMMRRSVVRYMVLTQVLVFRDISLQVRRRFPALDAIVAAGFMLETEKDLLNDSNLRYARYFLPIEWCTSLLYQARSEGKIGADLLMNELSKHVLEFRKGLAQLCNFDWVPIPLAYPQVVFLAVRSYFLMSVVARQSVLIDGQPPADENPLYPLVPFIMSALQFVFVVGWMKVAESMINPLGEDDDDFECNFLLDRNLSVGLSIVDECYNRQPDLEKDVFWSTDVEPLYSSDTALIPKNPQIGSAANYEMKDEEVLMMPHVDDMLGDELDFKDSSKLIPRKHYSVMSVAHPFGSGTSLPVTRKRSAFAFDAITRKINNRSNSRQKLYNSWSQATLNGNFQMDDNAEEGTTNRHKNSSMLLRAPENLLDYEGNDNSISMQKLSCDLTTVEEEDEERAKSTLDKSHGS